MVNDISAGLDDSTKLFFLYQWIPDEYLCHGVGRETIQSSNKYIYRM